MLPVVLDEMKNLQASLCGMQYQSDHTDCMVILNRKLGQGVKARLIFDRGNFKSSSCTRQAPRMKELFEAGCQLRVLQPPHGGYSCMHTKTLIFDQGTVLTGSVNMTHNGFEHNKEHLFRITDARAVSDVLADFESTWEEAEVVDNVLIGDMMARYDKAEAEKAERARAKPSRSRSLSVQPRGRRHRNPGLASVDENAEDAT